MLLSVDPGKHRHGCALWEDRELTAAWYTRKGSSLLREVEQYIPIELLTHIVIEYMQIYAKTGVAKGNDLLAVNFSAGRAVGEIQIQGHVESLTIYRPHGWKGSVPKNIMNDRIMRELSEAEKSRIEFPSADSLKHNVKDGIGIGLKYWGRLP